jgi:DNA-binding MarR family transcriptional regulator
LHTHLLLASAGSSLTRGIEDRIRELGFDLTRPRYTIVRMLHLSPDQELPQNEIAQAMGVSAPNVTQLIDGLASEGWVERVASATDRRVTCARLTPSGKQRANVLVPAIVDYMIASVSGLSVPEMAQLTSLLRKVHARLQELG